MTFVVTEKAGLPWLIDLCQMISTKSHNVWYTIDADHVTSLYLYAGLSITENEF